MPDLVTKAFTLFAIIIAVICLSIYLDIPPQVIFELMAKIRSVSHQASLNVDLAVQIRI